MPFNRPPRIPIRRNEDTISLPPPPVLPVQPGAFGWVATLLPVGGSVLAAGLMLAAGGAGGATYLLMLPTMVLGAAAGWISYRGQKRDYQTKLEKARREYREALDRTENRLLALRERERQLLGAADPGLDACLQRIRGRDSRLGERRPADPDFLCLRLGCGSRPAHFRVIPAETQNRPPEFSGAYPLADGIGERFRAVSEAPVTVRMPRLGSIGICGTRPETLAQARALACHLVTHHWPAEAQIAVVAADPGTADWDWMRALPHRGATLEAEDRSGEGARAWAKMDSLERELNRRQRILDAQPRSGGQPGPALLPALVVIFDHLPADFSHPGLSQLLRSGRALGAYGIFLTTAPESIPGECHAVIRLRGSQAALEETLPDGERQDYQADSCPPATAAQFSKALARIDWPQERDHSRPPAMVTLREVLGGGPMEDLPIERWWDSGSPFGFLRAPIGRTSETADFLFDLRDQEGGHGPHGLIGGMTGSGKSEVLKTILLALAATHHPQDLTYVLIDYKGGAAFNELARLPHTVGVVTDIESHASYAERILAALTGEVERRKRILEQARGTFRFARSHVDEYRALRVRRPLPHLVVVFDEFAEFKGRHPEESRRLISIARLGRSLGVHLILATQNIQAAVDPQILQNSSFRICLKVSQAEDSLQMLGVPDAIQLPRGRALIQAQGRSEVQIAYSGGKARRADGAGQPGGWVRVHRDGTREHLAASSAAAAPSMDATEAGGLVERIRQAASVLSLPEPSAVWRDPLPDRVYLPDLADALYTGGWTGTGWLPCRRSSSGEADAAPEPILGLADYPERQDQPVLEMASGAGGDHLLVFGSAGTGKTTLLRTLVASIATQNSPAQAQIYILDGGCQSALKPLAEFPHTGAVVTLRESERAERMITFLQRELRRRSEVFHRAGVDTRADYNRLQGESGTLPYIYFLIDGLLEIKRAYPPEFLHAVTSLLNGGAVAGIRIVLTAHQQSDVPGDLFANISFRVTFHQPNPAEYAGLTGMPCDVRIQEEAGTTPRPGRGLLKGKPPADWQAALPVRGPTDRQQSAGLAALAREMRAAWTDPLPAPVRDLPDRIGLEELLAANAATGPLFAPIGLDFDTLEPLGFSLKADGPLFLVAGAAGCSGKTTLLHSWMVGLMRRYGPERIRFHLVDFHSRSLRAFRKCAHTAAYVDQASGLRGVLDGLMAENAMRAEEADRLYREDPDGSGHSRWLDQLPANVIVIDDYDRFAAKCEDGAQLLAECAARGGEWGTIVIAAGNAVELPRDYDDPLMHRMRRHGCGVLLNGTQELDQFNNTRIPAGRRPECMPPGRGWLVRRGQAQLFQTAVCWERGDTPKEALARIFPPAG